MELQQDGPVLLKSEFQQFCGKAIRPHCFRICHCLHRCGNLLLRGLDPEGTRDWMLRQPLRDVGIEHVGFRVQQRAGETYPPLADTPFVAQQSSFLVADELWFDLLRLLQLHRSDVLEKSVLVSHAQLLLQLNDVALEETNDCCTSHFLQPVTCLPDGPPQLRVPGGVRFQALPRCVHRISRSLQFSFRSGVSTLTSPRSPSFLGWDHQFSGLHAGTFNMPISY